MSAGGPGYWMQPLPPALPLVPLDEMIARIEASRLEEAPPLCPTCGSTANETLLQQRWCSECQRWLARNCFARDRSRRTTGRAYRCLECNRRNCKAYRSRRAKGGQLPLLEVAS
jgi:hypothetical protein